VPFSLSPKANNFPSFVSTKVDHAVGYILIFLGSRNVRNGIGGDTPIKLPNPN